MLYKILYDGEDDLITRLLKIRNISDSFTDFFNPRFDSYRNDPFLFSGIIPALERVKYAIEHHQRIIIFGDYDVDGVTSTYLLYSFIKDFLGYSLVSVRLPNRLTDGYGMKPYHIDEIKKLGVQLIITVDNGITAVNEVEYANRLGIDVIITDHHQPLATIPNAFAVINPLVAPDYPFKQLAGVGVVFKFVWAYAKYFHPELLSKLYYHGMSVVTIGTVADCVPLVGENRLLVAKGLEIINKKQGVPIGLSTFIEALNIKQLSSYAISFQVAPRLNAGGRLLSPYESFYCLLHTRKEKQIEYIQKLEELNTQRRQLQTKIFKEVDTGVNDKKCMFAAGEYHEGVIGIIAGKLTEKYNKPSIVIGIDHAKGIGVGSLRGPDNFSVIDMLYEVRDLLDRFGGHKKAGGLTVTLDKLPALEQRIHEVLDSYEPEPKYLLVDTTIRKEDIASLGKIEKLEPFGEGNPMPLLLFPNVFVHDVQKVGSKGNGHLKMRGDIGGENVSFISWGDGDKVHQYVSTQCDIIGSVRSDSFGSYIDVKHTLVK